jgi:hypothetical protein
MNKHLGNKHGGQHTAVGRRYAPGGRGSFFRNVYKMLTGHNIP